MITLRSISNLFKRKDKNYVADFNYTPPFGEVILSTSNLPWIELIKKKYNNDVSMTSIIYKMTVIVTDENKEYLCKTTSIANIYSIRYLSIRHTSNDYKYDIFFSGNENQYKTLINDLLYDSSTQDNIYLTKLMVDVNNHLKDKNAIIFPANHDPTIKDPCKYIYNIDKGFFPPDIEILGYSKICVIDLQNIIYGKNILTLTPLWMCINVDLVNAFSSISKDLLILDGGKWALLKMYVSDLIWYLNDYYCEEDLEVKKVIKKILNQNQTYFSSILNYAITRPKDEYEKIDEDISEDKIPKSVEIKKENEEEFIRDSEIFPEHFFEEDESLDDMSVDDMVELLKN